MGSGRDPGRPPARAPARHRPPHPRAAPAGYGAAPGVPAPVPEETSADEEDDYQTPVLSTGAAALWLGGITLLVAACSEALTGSIEEVSHKWGLSQVRAAGAARCRRPLRFHPILSQAGLGGPPAVHLGPTANSHHC
jgi:hypothetical protein